MEKTYTPEDKYQLECRKLDKEYELQTRSFWRQPGTIFTIVPLVISLAVNLQQCKSRNDEKTLADIKLEETKLDIRDAKSIKDSVTRDLAQLVQSRDQVISDLQKTRADLNNLRDSASNASDRVAILTRDSSSLAPQTIVALRAARVSFDRISVLSDNAAKKIQNKDLAAQREADGYHFIMSGKYSEAAAAFAQSEGAYNGYHSVYDLSRLLSAPSVAGDPASRNNFSQRSLKVMQSMHHRISLPGQKDRCRIKSHNIFF